MRTGTSRRRSDRWAADGTLLALLAVVFFVDLFLPWSPSCFLYSAFIPNALGAPAIRDPALHFCGTIQNGLGGAGFGAAALALAVFAWEGLRVARIPLPLGPAYRSLVSSFLAATLLLLTLLDLIPRFGGLVSYPGTIPFGGAFAWAGLLLAVLVAAAGFVHWRIWHRAAPDAVGAWRMPPASAGPAAAGAGSAPRRCPGCGRLASADAGFCVQCGTALPA